MSEDKKYIVEENDVIKVRTCAWSPPGDHPIGCGLFLHVKDGKVVKVEGDPDHPVTNGRLCPRCLALTEVMYHPDRLLSPMIRDRADRGKDKWQAVSWDEAYDLIESKVRGFWDEFGSQSIVTLTGTGRESTLYAPVYASSVLNTPNATTCLSGLACYGPRCTIADYHLGAGYPELDYAAYFPDRYDDPRYEVPKYLLIWGKDPIYANADGLFGHAVVDLMKRGSELIIVDPRVTWLATRAAFHIQLRPGTDVAVGLGMINVIISEGLYDKDFVEKWCYGFDELAECAAEYPPERVAEIAWIDKDVLIAASRAFAQGKPSSALWGLAIDQMKAGVQAGHCFLAIVAICGYLDIPGGVTLAMPSSFMGKWRYQAMKNVPDEIRALRIVDPDGKYAAFNSGGAMPGVLPDSLLDWLENENAPYKMKMSWWIGTNPLACMAAQPQRWYQALNTLEFTVAQDIFMTPSIMALADVVLPLATFAEHDGIVMPHFGRNTHFLGAMNKAVDSDTKSDLEILIDMGKRLRPELWPYESVSEFFTEQLHTTYDWGFEELKDEVVHQQHYEYRKYETGKLRGDGEPGFQTPTGLVELKSTIYPMFGEGALPYYEEPEYSLFTLPADVVEKNPLVFTTGGRNLTMFHSEHRQIPSLRAVNPWPRVTIHPDTAAEYGIEEGDWVCIESEIPQGKCVQKASLRKTLDPRVIHMEHGWWFPEQDGEAPHLYGAFVSNPNNLVPHESIGKTGYGAPYKNGICTIRKVDSLLG